MNKDLHPVSRIMIIIAFAVICLCCIIPLITIISISFSTDVELTKQGYSIFPRAFTLAAYEYALKNAGDLVNAYFISISTTLSGTLIGLTLNSLVAYVLSRDGFWARKQLTLFYLFPMLFSGGMVAGYIWATQYLHLKDTFLVLIVGAFVSPWNIIMLRTFFRQVPASLFEAALMDGAGEMTIWRRIAIPLAKPALASIGLFTALALWNDWFTPMMYINNRGLYNVQYKLYMIMKNAQELARNIAMSGLSMSLADLPTESMRMALCVITVIPMLIVFPFFQKYFVKGLTVGGVKG